jgi:hypothetical protein
MTPCRRLQDTKLMKAKIFEGVLHKPPSGKSPATALEVSPAEPNALPRSEESSIIVFCTLFYTD